MIKNPAFKLIMILSSLLLLLILILASCALAEGGEGGSLGAFLELGAGARAIALGKAFSAVADDANAVLYNPAGLTEIKQDEIMFMYSKPFLLVEDVNQGMLTYIHPLPRASVGASLIYFKVGGIEVVEDESGPTGETFSDTETALLISYAYKIDEKLSLGANFKLITQAIKDKSGTGYGLDVGLLYNLSENLKIGLSLQDIIGAQIKLFQKTDTIPFKIRVGASYSLLEKRLLVAIDSSISEGKAIKLFGGVEYQVNEGFSLRGGYNTASQEVSAGVGIKLSQYQLDYAFSFNELGNSHRISLIVRL